MRCPNCDYKAEFEIQYGYEWTSEYKNGKFIKRTYARLPKHLWCPNCQELTEISDGLKAAKKFIEDEKKRKA